MKYLCTIMLFGLLLTAVRAQTPTAADGERNYRVGPDDQISIRVQDLEKLQLENTQAPRVDVNGNLNLPLIGHVHAAGLTLDELEQAIAAKLQDVLQHPSVSASIVQYRNHPVSVLGAVRTPGVLQVAQHRRLLEVLSMAGGLATDAGDKIKVSRKQTSGALPLSHVVSDGTYWIGSIDVRSLMQASDPSANIEVLENDVITVPRAELVYVLGAVKRAGGFTLGEHEKMSVVQAVSLAEGFGPAASPKIARLLREDPHQKERQEFVINLNPIMSGKASDVFLQANDILYIPTNTGKLVTMKGLETAVQVGAGLAIFH